MAGVGGPKNPGPPGAPPGTPLRPLRTGEAEPVAEAKPVQSAPEPTPAAGADAFVAKSPERTGPRLVPLEGGQKGQGALQARLQAMGIKETPQKKAGQTFRVVDGPQGRVAEGKVRIESASQLERLRGVVAVHGELSIAETGRKGLSLDALSSLVRVDGRLTLEGNEGLRALEGLGALEVVGDTVYLGFNDALGRAHLPSLREVGGALIVEANAHLEELVLPSLASVARYLHVHENPRLTRLYLPELALVGGDLSLLDNRRLVAARLGAPAHLGGSLEVAKNGAAQVRGLSIA